MSRNYFVGNVQKWVISELFWSPQKWRLTRMQGGGVFVLTHCSYSVSVEIITNSYMGKKAAILNSLGVDACRMNWLETKLVRLVAHHWLRRFFNEVEEAM